MLLALNVHVQLRLHHSSLLLANAAILTKQIKSFCIKHTIWLYVHICMYAGFEQSVKPGPTCTDWEEVTSHN